jgi:hypothetical protein
VRRSERLAGLTLFNDRVVGDGGPAVNGGISVVP